MFKPVEALVHTRIDSLNVTGNVEVGLVNLDEISLSFLSPR